MQMGFYNILFAVVFCLHMHMHMICFSNAQQLDSISVNAPMEATEQAILYSTIQDLVGKDWNGSDLYPDPCGWSPIQGVSCDFLNGYWHVTVLSFGQVYDNSLNCTPISQFGHGLFQLKYLKKLTFSNCFLSTHQKPVRLPHSGWEQLSNTLEYLEFRSNPCLIETIPPAFGTLRNLESLVLIDNGLTGELPDNIGQLTKLKRLVLAGNRLFGQIPASYGALNQLLILDTSRNQLSGELPSSIGSLSSLIKLDLSNNKLSGRIPSEIGNLKNVTLLDLSHNNFSDGLIDSMQEMWSLQEMLLSNNPIGGTLIGISWKNLKNLEVLDLSNTNLTGNIPNSMTKVMKLRFLGLGNNRLTGNIPQMLQNLPYIRSLSINGNNFSGQLEFSEPFYEKMGNRFRACDNVDLCFPSDLVSSTNVPFGVKPCE